MWLDTVRSLLRKSVKSFENLNCLFTWEFTNMDGNLNGPFSKEMTESLMVYLDSDLCAEANWVASKRD